MTLRVWRLRDGLHAECTKCGSFGTAGHLQLQQKLAPDVQERLDKHEAHMLTLRGHFTTAVNNIVKQIRDGSLERRAGSAKISELQQNFTGQIVLAHNSLPKERSGVSEFATKCPWCDAVEQVDVVQLPDDTAEPPFELAKVVAAFQQKAATQARKGK